MISVLTINSQTIIPVEKTKSYMDAGGLPDGIYFKDINNLFTKYLGIWKGTYKNKNYTFVVTKFKDDFLGTQEDKLLIRYLITNSSGVVVEDTRSLAYGEPNIIQGNYFTKDLIYYVAFFTGHNFQCGNKGTVFIRMKNAINTQMSLTFEPDKIMMSEDSCPGLKLAELTLPREGMMLTKQ